MNIKKLLLVISEEYPDVLNDDSSKAVRLVFIRYSSTYPYKNP